MALPKVPPMNMSQLRTQFGGNLPINLSAYYAGAGLVPVGTTNGANNLIPSSGAMRLSDFLGAPNGILLSDYVGQLQYYNRNYHAWQAAFTPATSTNWNSGSDHDTPPNGGIYNTLFYQNYLFNNAGLKTSPGCTVVFTIAGSTTNNQVYPAVPGGSAIGSVAKDFSNFALFQVWAESNRHCLVPSALWFDWKNSSVHVLTIVAQYACSCTAISKVTVGWDAVSINTDAGTYPVVQVIPGLWTPSIFAFGQGSFGLNLGANSCALTVSHRAGDGNYSLEQSGGMGLIITYADHWYNNDTFQWNFNTTTSTQGVTYSNQGSSEQGAVYQFTQSTAGLISGINVAGGSNVRGFATPIISADTPLNGGSSQMASITFMPSGGAYGSGDNGATVQSFESPIGGGADVVAGWYYGATLTSNPGNNYWIKAVLSGGQSTTSGASLNTWIPLSTNVTFAYTYTGTTSSSSQLSFQIATNSSGANAVSLGGCVLLVINGTSGGGGGGGGGGCVAVESFLPNFGRARNVQVSHFLDSADQHTLEEFKGEVTHAHERIEHGFRIVTESGAALRCSDTAPIPVEDGSLRHPYELRGQRVAVKRIGTDGVESIRYESVIDVQDIGQIAVQLITIGDRCFWAGEQDNAFILHHNKIAQTSKPDFAKHNEVDDAVIVNDPTQSVD